MKENGIVTEDAWPYTSADGVTGECFPEKMKDPFLRTISGITDVPPFREELMVNALAKVGPISIAIDAGKWIHSTLSATTKIPDQMSYIKLFCPQVHNPFHSTPTAFTMNRLVRLH